MLRLELDALSAEAIELQRTDISRSTELYRELLLRRRTLHGDTHPHTLYAIGHLSASLRDVGQLCEAEQLAQEQRSTSADLLGELHPDTLSADSNLVSVLNAAGKHTEPIARRLLDRTRQLLGDHHEETLVAQSALAQAYLARGKHDKAELLARDDLKASNKLHGPRHNDTLVALSNLASALLGQNKLPEAEQLMRKNLALCREIHGGSHTHTLTAIHNLVHLLRKKGMCKDELGSEVEPLLQEQSETSARVLGSRHPETIYATETRASLLVHLGRLREAHAVISRLHGDTHPWTLKLLSTLATQLHEQDGPAEAEPFARKLYVACRNALGEDSAFVLHAQRHLASCLRQQGKLKEAAELSVAAHFESER